MNTLEKPIHNNSEIGTLRSVLLHRPGGELENLTPDTMAELLFDDVPYLREARREHDAFANVLRTRGAEVLYLDQLAIEALADDEVRKAFTAEMIEGSGIESLRTRARVASHLADMTTHDMVWKVMQGIRKDELPGGDDEFQLVRLATDRTLPFHLAPMPNLYFTRDPAAAIGDGLTINHMRFPARQRESLFMRYIVSHHPRFAKSGVKVWYDREQPYAVEGGDELVLSDRVMAIGMSQRTSPQAVEMIARELFDRSTFDTVIGVEIPDSRAFMHLDTVFTMVGPNSFSIHPEVRAGSNAMKLYVMKKRGEHGDMAISEESDLTKVLCDTLGLDGVQLIECGAGDPIAAAREQWNDGSNTLAIAPNVVVTYDRNTVTNRALRESGIEVIEVPSGELSRGRGGPRCMSMPLVRDDL